MTEVPPPMCNPIPGTAAFYRAQARKVRKIAEAEPTIAIRRQLLRIARDYEKLADEEEHADEDEVSSCAPLPC
jgi:hypothetical protein